MNNYVIEGGVNFWDELLKDDENDHDDSEKCLISDQILVDKHITLTCGHKFNYTSLYNDVVQQKSSSNMESRSLGLNQFRCPYCRTKQNKLLPSLKGYAVCHGVNSPLKYCMFLIKCPYVFKSGKRKGKKCDINCNDEYCKQHMKSKLQPPEIEHTCTAILKSGKRKGELCGLKSSSSNVDYCTRHNNLFNNNKKK